MIEKANLQNKLIFTIGDVVSSILDGTDYVLIDETHFEH